MFRKTALLCLLGFGSLTVACGDTGPGEISRYDFCEEWAGAACSSEVVSVCQASSKDDCKAAQSEACLDALPNDFVDRGVDDCIRAVKKAYEDADLTAKELDVVLRYGGACSEIFIANETGERCKVDADCEPSLRCIVKDEEEGTCQKPVIIEAGFSCSEPEETCEEGFYCDGKNCLAALEEGDDCQNDHQCGPDMYCDETCTEKVDVGEDCKTDAECVSGICYRSDDDRTCLDRLRLSPAEPMCSDLK